MILEYCKLQIGCMLILLYIAFLYWKEQRRLRQKRKFTMFDGLLMLGLFEVFFDGLTAYTVNHLDSVNVMLNRVLHAVFLSSIDSFIFLLFFYMLSITMGLPKKKSRIAI